MPRKYNAYLTVYLSLVFGIVLSLLFVLIEGAATGAARAQSELVADLGLDSVFAEYNREVLNQYELFFIDTSYGGVNGGIGMTESHLAEYMDYNMNPDKDLMLFGESTLLGLCCPYLEIEEASYASDEDCMVWKTQAVQYMKAVYGGDIMDTVKEHIDTVQENGWMDRDVAGELLEQKKAFEQALSEKGIVEFGAESAEGFSYGHISGLFDKIVGGGLLALVLPEGESVSGAVADSGVLFSERKRNGLINRGVGVHEGAKKPDGILDELIYDRYLMKMCGCYGNPKQEGRLQYQIEYILCGSDSDAANLRRSVELLFALRAAANLTSLFADSEKKSEVELVAEGICWLLAVPEFTDALAFILSSVWALAESAADVHHLLCGGKVPLMKKGDEWRTGLTGIFGGSLYGEDKETAGLTYENYLQIFLGVMNRDVKAARSLDIVEMDIRGTDGNAQFRIDRCIDYLNVNFGFQDTGGHDFVFRKKMCYES
ncbi:MAG: hypothetical protein K2P44_14795 [Lachnospiraceae bacterium]|nr:hypothetical protein [Lachnospiraceae bacterium]